MTKTKPSQKPIRAQIVITTSYGSDACKSKKGKKKAK